MSSLRARRRRRRRLLKRRDRRYANLTRAQIAARYNDQTRAQETHLGIRSDYLHMLLDPSEREACLRFAIQALTPRLKEFDAFAVTGYSGCLLAGTLADRLGKGIILVRKEGTDGRSHSSMDVEGLLDGPVRWVFLDDFVATGETRDRVRERIAAMNPRATHVFTYTFRWGGRISDDYPPVKPEPEAMNVTGYDFILGAPPNVLMPVIFDFAPIIRPLSANEEVSKGLNI